MRIIDGTLSLEHLPDGTTLRVIMTAKTGEVIALDLSPDQAAVFARELSN